MTGRHAHPKTSGLGDQRAVLASVGLTLLAVIVAMVVLWPDQPPRSLPPSTGKQLAGSVVSVSTQGCPELRPGSAPQHSCGTVDVRVSEGTRAGQTVKTPLPGGTGAPVIAVGDKVVLLYTAQNPSDRQYQIIDHDRGTQLWLLGAALALSILAFGRLRGLAAIFGLAITFAVLLLFIVPAILAGRPPLLVAVVGSIAIALTVLYLTHGISRTTTVAVAGTVASLTLTGLLSSAAVHVTQLSGVADETSASLGQLYGVNMQGLLLAAIIIGSLGVLDDATVTQAVTVEELAEANPQYGARELYHAANRVGRAHIASVINTIILAYAGASLPLLVLITALNDPVGQVLSDPLVATEIVRSAVGTVGLIAAVPITTALAASWGVRQSRRSVPVDRPSSLADRHT